jgi:DHA3 family macrolide efflux protein-like MFS transporter
VVTQDSRPRGMTTFIAIWLSQAMSLLGSSMTGFGLSIWAWEKTGQATALALAAFFYAGATMLASPLAGALVDRWNRKLVMALSDLAAVSSTAVLLALLASGQLQIWHIFVANAFSGFFQAFQWPAYSAAVTMLVPKKHYARAGAMMSLAESAGFVLAPILAAILLGAVGLAGVMAVDMVTAGLAVAVVLLMRVPQPGTSAAGLEGRGSLWKESLYGFRYIFERPGLLGLQMIFFAGNLLDALAFTLLAPLVLSRTADDVLALGSVQSAVGVGALIGSLILSVWGGPRRRVHGVLLGWTLSALLGQLLFGLGRTPTFWAITGFALGFVSPVVNASNQAIWQAKVAPDVQGRVFSVRRLIAQVSAPLAMLVTGPLADQVFEPAMRGDSGLARVFGGLVGTGPGSGIALLFVFCGVLGVATSLAGYAFRQVRDVETILPDHDEAAPPVRLEPALAGQDSPEPEQEEVPHGRPTA